MSLELYLLVGIVFLGLVLVLVVIGFITAWFYVTSDSHDCNSKTKNN